MQKLIELKKFYEYKNKLLHASEFFIGFNPIISLTLAMPSSTSNGVLSIKQNFIVGDEVFNSVFSTSKTSGQIAGFKRIELYKDDKRIIFTERGGLGYGVTYSKGRNFFIKDDRAYLLAKGTAIKDFENSLPYGNIIAENYYLLVFSNITIPVVFPFRKIKSKTKFPSRNTHIASKVTLWKGVLDSEEGEIEAVCSTIVGVGTWWDTHILKPKPQGRVEFFINGLSYFFESSF